MEICNVNEYPSQAYNQLNRTLISLFLHDSNNIYV